MFLNLFNKGSQPEDVLPQDRHFLLDYNAAITYLKIFNRSILCWHLECIIDDFGIHLGFRSHLSPKYWHFYWFSIVKLVRLKIDFLT